MASLTGPVTEAEILMMADLERIANIVHVTEISSRHVWTYLGGSDRVPYDRYCQLVCIRMLGKIPDTITKSVIALLTLKYGTVFRPTTLVPRAKAPYSNQMGTRHKVFSCKDEKEKFLFVDITLIQEVISGDDAISIRDELYTYLKAAARGIDEASFARILQTAVGFLPDDVITSFRNNMHLVKERFGDDFVPTTCVPNQKCIDLLGFDSAQLKGQNQKGWLGETRPGRVGKMKLEQIRLMMAVIDAVRHNTSDFIDWKFVLEKSGLGRHGASIQQLSNKFLHLTEMAGIQNLADYEQACTTPSLFVSWAQKQHDVIKFPARSPPDEEMDSDVSSEDVPQCQRLRLTRGPRTERRVFWNREWRKVLGTSVSRSLHLPSLDQREWKALFKSCDIPSQNVTGASIMNEFYGLVVPQIRQNFGLEGGKVNLFLRGASYHHMMVLVGAINEPWDENAVYAGIRRLNEEKIISFSTQWPNRFWGSVLFSFIENALVDGFEGNKRNLKGLKTYFQIY